MVEWKLAARKKKFLKIFAPLELSSQNGYAAALGKCYSQGIKFGFTKSTLNSWWAVGILMLSNNWRGINFCVSHEIPPILNNKEDDGSTKKKSIICNQKGIGNREHVCRPSILSLDTCIYPMSVTCTHVFIWHH